MGQWGRTYFKKQRLKKEIETEKYPFGKKQTYRFKKVVESQERKKLRKSHCFSKLKKKDLL